MIEGGKKKEKLKRAISRENSLSISLGPLWTDKKKKKKLVEQASQINWLMWLPRLKSIVKKRGGLHSLNSETGFKTRVCLGH